MKSSIILTSLSASLAAADFQISWTREQVDGLEGASFFNSAPSCDDSGNSVTVVNLGGRNDASSGGVSPALLSADLSRLTHICGRLHATAAVPATPGIGTSNALSSMMVTMRLLRMRLWALLVSHFAGMDDGCHFRCHSR